MRAYAIARFRLPFGLERKVGLSLLTVRIVPPVVILIPVYLLMLQLHLLDTWLGLILTYTAFNITFCVWMMESFFREIPVDLEEAAMVDGDSRFTAFRRIALPLAAPGLAATAIFAVIVTFNEFLFALALTATPRAMTMPRGTATLIGRIDTDWASMSAAGVIGALPIVFFALFVQRHLVRGLTMGAVKSQGQWSCPVRGSYDHSLSVRRRPDRVRPCGQSGPPSHAFNLRYIVDPRPEAAGRIPALTGARIVDTETALNDPEVDGVMIAAATVTHADLAMAAAAKGKAIFCEKPIDLDLARTDACLEAVAQAGVLFQIGFNRRFDPSFHALKQRLDAGAIGRVEQVIITSRDPEPETEEALAGGGGVFREMTIHDFDMARHLLGEEPVRMFATGSCLVDPAYAKLGDYDTAMFILRTASGRQCHINNSVRATYGYDQRIEVLGSEGMLRAANRVPTSVELSTVAGVSTDKPLYFFVERYGEAYAAELDHFVTCIETGRTPDVGAQDGRRAMILCEAALASAKSGRFELRLEPDT